MKLRRTRLLIFTVIVLGGVIVLLTGTSLYVSNLLQGIGTELLAAGLIAILLELILQDEFLDVIKSELKSPVKELGIGQKVAPIFEKSFKLAQERIDILALTFTVGSDSYKDHVLEKAHDSHCQIRILIMDPSSSLVGLRSRDEPDRSPERIRDKIKHSLEVCRGLDALYRQKYADKDPPKGSVRVKTYVGIPYFAYSRMDDRCYLTPYLSFAFGIHSPVLEVRSEGSELFRYLEKHFDVLWEREDSHLCLDIGYFGRSEEQFAGGLPEAGVAAHNPAPAADA